MDPQTFFELLRRHGAGAIPHAVACGMVVESVDERQALMRLPYRETWLGDLERGLIHTGAISALIDQVCGTALLGALRRFERIATLDLRLDYLRPARPPKDILARAECYRLTRSIAFVRARAWQDDEAEPCAVAHAAFMRSSSGDKAAVTASVSK